MIEKPCEVQFANEKVKEAFDKLELEDSNLKKFIERAFCDIKQNPFCGIQIPKKQIPTEYIKNGIFIMSGSIIFLMPGD